MSRVAAYLESSSDLVSPRPAASDAAWTTFHRRWSRLAAPQRPPRMVIDEVRALVRPCDERVLLLGVTPELAAVARQTVAIDWNDRTIAHIWPGDTVARRAMRGDWRDLPCGAGSFSAAMGDGSLNCLAYPHGYARVFSELARALRPGARVVFRVYLTPEPGDTLADVHAQTHDRAVATIHALKWRIANALCARSGGNPNVAVDLIARTFDGMFPHRDCLAAITGWPRADIAQMDDYRGRPEIYSFPTARQLVAVVPAGFTALRFVPTAGYPLAERCPLFVLETQ